MSFSSDEISALMNAEISRYSGENVGKLIHDNLTVSRAVRHRLEDWQEPTLKKVLLRDMYKKPKLEKALVLLSLGFGTREVAKMIGLSKYTTGKLRQRMLKVADLRCGCGQWCRSSRMVFVEIGTFWEAQYFISKHARQTIGKEADMTAKRIQRKRTKGWKMPPNTIYVGRPTIWGNPFWHLHRFSSLEDSLIAYRMAVEGVWEPNKLKHVGDGPFHIACADFSEFIKRFPFGARNTIKSELRGKDLACWCPLDQPCHADILLEIANDTGQAGAR